jgi:ectoine hydroxylase-related dioxygenase (phytanoyl-CoA dioxygenase family)
MGVCDSAFSSDDWILYWLKMPEEAQKTKGTGLGLPITKGFAELLGGSISVQSMEGKGSTYDAPIEFRGVVGRGHFKEGTIEEILRNCGGFDGKGGLLGRRKEVNMEDVDEIQTGATNESGLEQAKEHLDAHGYCIIEGAIRTEEAAALHQRLTEQAAAEAELDKTRILPDKKWIVSFLLNKGQRFRDLLFHPVMRELVGHVLGELYLLSSYNGHIVPPGNARVYHTDQWWMPRPTDPKGESLNRTGSINRDRHRGHHQRGNSGVKKVAVAPACTCNVMWMVDDFTAENGATIVVPGSHLSGREPDPELDEDADWIPAEAPAGSFVVLDGRVWHSTGENVSDRPRIGLTTNFCSWQFRQQENLPMGLSQEVLDSASDDLLDLIGFRPSFGYGSIGDGADRIERGRYALGELKPRGNG